VSAADKLLLQLLNILIGIRLLNSGFLEIFGSGPISREECQFASACGHPCLGV